MCSIAVNSFTCTTTFLGDIVNTRYFLIPIGMLSKSKGQILRVAATMHVLFHINEPLDIPAIIGEDAIKASENFVEVCLQNAAYLAGRGDIKDAVDDIQRSKPPGSSF